MTVRRRRRPKRRRELGELDRLNAEIVCEVGPSDDTAAARAGVEELWSLIRENVLTAADLPELLGRHWAYTVLELGLPAPPPAEDPRLSMIDREERYGRR